MIDNHGGGHAEEYLCDVCQKIDIREYLFQDLCPGTIKLGGFQEILEKDTCPFCRLVIQALSVNSEDYWENRKYPTEVCYLGRHDKLPRPSILEVWFDQTSKTFPQGICGHNTTRGEILLASDNAKITGLKPKNVGKLLTSHIDFSLLRQWLSECEKQHGNKCSGLNTNILSKHPSSLILIDVKRYRLVERTSDCRYITLSYVWGEVPVLQTLTSNFSELKKDGALKVFSDQLPTVINDAIEVVAGLGESYIWIDALCIIQDGAEKLKQISLMNTIYGQAILTIVALAGNDASAGLPGIRPESRRVSQGCENIHGMRLMIKLPELSTLLQKSRWESRGWTFQERILSNRCLYFTNTQVYFQCRSSICREDVLGEYCSSSLISPGAGNPLEREVSPTDSAYGPKFNIYESLIKAYSRRKLSYQSDILNAFSGIMSALHERFGWSFVSALPENELELALSWRPMASCYQRFPSARTTANIASMSFPTWCWTAWVGDIYWDAWRTDSYAGNEIHLESQIEYFKVKDATGVRTIKTKYRKAGSLLLSGKSSLTSYSLTEEEVVMENLVLAKALPDLPALYFWTQALKLESLSISFEKQYSQEKGHHASSRPRSWFGNQAWIYDDANHHYGTITSLESWPLDSNYGASNHELILLFRARQKVVTNSDVEAFVDRLPLEYPSHQEYYDEMFDTDYYTPTEDWAMTIMLIEWKGEYAVRVAVGQIHAHAWERATPQRRFVTLA